MKLSLFVATVAILLWGVTPAFAGLNCPAGPDGDGDTVVDVCDNCSDRPNPAQDDTDKDQCGNICGPY